VNDPARVYSTVEDGVIADGVVVVTNMPAPLIARSVGELVWEIVPCSATSWAFEPDTPPAAPDALEPVTRVSKSTLLVL